MSDAQYRFLPWVRTGLAAGIPQDQAESTGRAAIAITLSVDRGGGAPVTIAKSGRLYGPGDAVGLDPRQVIRTDPPAGTTTFEPNYFPAIEFDAPELPWMLSPAAPKGKDWLSPWICLVVVERGDKVRLVADAKPLPKLVFAGGAGAELPDLDQAALWAHAQVAGGVEPVATLVAGNPAQNLSRLLCARRLRAGVAYLACVVPTYLAGAQAGLGKPVTAKAEPAWATNTNALELPVYFSWEFSTGPDGDFEALASRLEGRKLGSRVGLRPMDVRKPGGGLPAPSSTGILDLEGALQAQTLEPTKWTKADRDQWTGALVLSLRAAPGGQQVVTPPVYGSAPAGADGLPPNAPGWLTDLNLDPRTRAAAGLGARVVHDQQEQLVASAWEQADEIERANQILRQAQLAQSVADAIYRTRLQPMDAETLLQVTAPAHARVSEGGATLEAKVAGSAFPESAASAAFRRAARPRGPIGRGLEDDSRGPLVDELAAGDVELPLRPEPDGTIAVNAVSPAVQLVDTEPRHFEELGIGWKYARDIRDPTAGVASRMRSAGAPTLMAARMVRSLSRDREQDIESNDPRDTQGGLETDEYLKIRLANIRFRFRTAAKPMQDHLLAAPPEPPPLVQEDPLDLGAVKKTLAPDPGQGAGALDPATTVPARVLPLVPTADAKASDPLRPLLPAPRFDQPMMLPLRDLGQEFLLPGLGDVPPETVGLLQGNARFIESYLVGLNTALAQELLFRGYVTSPDATFFYRFWDGRGSVPGMSGPDAGPDIDPIASWGRAKPLGKHARGVGGAGMTLLLIRGELVRRNPQITVYAGKAVTPDDIRPELYPDFRGFLDPDAVFLGFAIAIGKLLADPTWHFVLEEHVTAPRFGLDESRLKANGTTDWGGTPATWNDAAWTDMAASAVDLDKLTYAPRVPPFGPLEHDDAVWGQNGAHMAAITFQNPVRVAFPATTLLKR